MADKPLTFTSHGQTAMAERNIQRAWIEMTVFNPDWTVPDPRPGRIRAFRAIADARGKILRVVYSEDEGVVTAFFDRDARRP